MLSCIVLGIRVKLCKTREGGGALPKQMTADNSCHLFKTEVIQNIALYCRHVARKHCDLVS